MMQMNLQKNQIHLVEMCRFDSLGPDCSILAEGGCWTQKTWPGADRTGAPLWEVGLVLEGSDGSSGGGHVGFGWTCLGGFRSAEVR